MRITGLLIVVALGLGILIFALGYASSALVPAAPTVTAQTGTPTPTICYHCVPTPDATYNVYIRDVVGSKEDGPLGTPTNVGSLVGYSKGILAMVSTPAPTTPPTEYDGVYCNTLGTTIALGGTGTPNNPLSTLSECISTADSWLVNKIYLADPDSNGWTFSADLTQQYEFIGQGNIVATGGVSFGGYEMSQSVFRNVYVSSGLKTNDKAEFYDSNVSILSGYGATYQIHNLVPYQLPTELQVGSGSITAYIDGGSISVVDGGYQANISLTLSNGHFADAHVMGVSNAASEYLLEGVGNLTIDDSCTAGTINVSGAIRLTDNSNGCTVNDYTLMGTP